MGSSMQNEPKRYFAAIRLGDDVRRMPEIGMSGSARAPPRFDLAGTGLSNFRVVDVVRTAQSCRKGFWCWYDQDREERKRENTWAGVNPTLPRSHEARRRLDRCRHIHTMHPCHELDPRMIPSHAI